MRFLHRSLSPIDSISWALLVVLQWAAGAAVAHDGPDPVMRWRFDPPSISRAQDPARVQARLGPDGQLLGSWRLVDDEDGGSLFLGGGQSGVVIADNYADLAITIPKDALTVSAWVSVDKRQRWGGLAGIIQDNGDQEAGWVLGYDESVFTFGLAGEKPGRMTYLAGGTPYELGKLYHVVAVYDGRVMQLYVNGKLDAESEQQAGPIAYPAAAPMMLGAYRDEDEFYGHRGRVREIAIYAMAAKPRWAQEAFAHHAPLAGKPAAPIFEPLAFEIAPYLQHGTQTSMTVMWKTNRPSSSVVHYGETRQCEQQAQLEEAALVHEVTLTGLKPETQYFYRVETQAEGSSETIEESVSTFQTAVREETPFAFAVISDTQGNPKVSGRLAEFAWEQRPNFLLHPGDLVSTGPNDSHWTEHFFPSMNPLIRRVPFFPVLGNHEQNARNYFDYVSLPNPEYYYTFRYGNMQLFMIDSNRNVDPESEQYQWLDQQLGASTAVWKLVCHHHPPFSSDENDYGDLWKTNVSTRGDMRVRQLVPLYERHQVDLVWNGHIHSYERTWPLREGRAVESAAPIYMITGGGGGGLETPGPIRPYFQNTVRRGHHYAMVRVNGSTLEIQVYDLENRLFDSLKIAK